MSESLRIDEVASLPVEGLIERYARGVENFDKRVFELTDAMLDTAFLPSAGVGRWPARVLLGHLADAELLLVHRMRRIAAEDGPVLAVWDEHAPIDAGLYGTPETGARYPVGAFIAVIHSLRKWHAEWMGTLSDGQWERTGLHPERGAVTIRSIADYATWHLEHHAGFLRKKIDRLLATGT